MSKETKIFSIAFEGPHRVGKGTQIELIEKKLEDIGIPFVSIKGEGYRKGLGVEARDPKSDFWEQLSEKIKQGENPDLWNEASYRLARELIVWRDRILSKKVEETLAPFGVLLIDRSLISNVISKSLHIKVDPEKVFSSDDLYPELHQNRKKISVDMVLPDVIFELIAPKDILLKRLDEADPDYLFRKSNIEDKYDLYMSAKKNLSSEIQERIVTIDASKDPNEVYDDIAHNIQGRFPELEDIKNH